MKVRQQNQQTSVLQHLAELLETEGHPGLFIQPETSQLVQPLHDLHSGKARTGEEFAFTTSHQCYRADSTEGGKSQSAGNLHCPGIFCHPS